MPALLADATIANQTKTALADTLNYQRKMKCARRDKAGWITIDVSPLVV